MCACSTRGGLKHWARIVAAEQPSESGNRVITVVPYAVLTDAVRTVMAPSPDEVPLARYIREVEAAGEFASPQVCAEYPWSAIDGAASGDLVPVGAVVIAERAAATAGVA